MTLTLGFSPCPNDTFIFDALVNRKIDSGDLQFEFILEDVETLNQWARQGKLDVTKLSFATMLQVSKTYALLQAGAALGQGVGPLLVCKKEDASVANDLENFVKKARIAIPGRYTTANLLLSLAHPAATNKTELIFSEIENAVLSGTFDAGLLIHEGRFTYEQRGLHQLMDLGAWWENSSGQAVPLGGIAARRNLKPKLAEKVENLIRESLAYAWRHYPGLSDFVTGHAQEMEEKVMRQHIELYVNEQSRTMDDAAKTAIETLHTRAAQAGILRSHDNSKTLWF